MATPKPAAPLPEKFDVDTYQYPGQYTHTDGIIYTRPVFGPQNIERVRTVQMDEHEVVVASYPKSGTTWTQEIVYQIKRGGVPPPSDRKVIEEDVPYIEFCLPGQPSPLDKPAGDRPKLWKTHLRSQYFSQQISEGRAKFIVVMRNPKDTLTSFYHFHHMMTRFQFRGDWDAFFTLHRQNRLVYGDCIEWNADWWQLREKPNVLVVKYEDMKRDHTGNIRKMADFIGCPLDDSALQRVVEATSFASMRSNPATNMEHRVKDSVIKGDFMRKGQVGDWKNYFSEEQSGYIEDQCSRILTPLGLTFDEL